MKIIVTGATGLIGKTLVPSLRDKGHEVIECSKSLGVDLTDEEQVEEFFCKHRAQALVNLFGLDDKAGCTKHVCSVPLDEIRDYLNVNVVALYNVCSQFAFWNGGFFKGSNSIVNFSSIYGVDSPDPKLYKDSVKHIGYAVSKAAVIQLSKYLAVHLAPACRVNSIICGGVLGGQDEEFVKKYSEKVPMGRLAEPKELVGLVEFLCSPSSSYCAGGEYKIDGGYTAL